MQLMGEVRFLTKLGGLVGYIYHLTKESEDLIVLLCEKEKLSAIHPLSQRFLIALN